MKAFFLGHLEVLQRLCHVSVVANTSNRDFLAPYAPDVSVRSVAICREIRPLEDLKALFHLYRLFRREKFDIVYSVTPKAGLLAMVAGMLAGISIRIHTFTGQVWVTCTGGKRKLLRAADKLLAFCATSLLADSFSQRDFLVAQGIVPGEKIEVLASGSISGVDTDRFLPDPVQWKTVRGVENIPEDSLVFLYLGRLNRDKGILDLAAAFSRLALQYAQIHLLLVGPDEEGLAGQVVKICSGCPERVHFVGYTEVPEQYMAAADVFCLPSYREGFGSVVIEAGAVGLPTVASRIYGIIDAVAEGETGLLVPPGDEVALQAAMEKMITQPTLREDMGGRARRRAAHEFSRQKVTGALVRYLLGDDANRSEGHGQAGI